MFPDEDSFMEMEDAMKNRIRELEIENAALRNQRISVCNYFSAEQQCWEENDRLRLQNQRANKEIEDHIRKHNLTFGELSTRIRELETEVEKLRTENTKMRKRFLHSVPLMDGS
jgi:chromosome segregation ATPase